MAPIVATDVHEALAMLLSGRRNSNGDDWTGLAAVGTNGDFVGSAWRISK
jgi:hypothetical protein